MGNFSPNTKNRAWIATVQISNIEKAGLSKNEYESPEYLAEFLCDRYASATKVYIMLIWPYTETSQL